MHNKQGFVKEVYTPEGPQGGAARPSVDESLKKEQFGKQAYSC